MRTSTEEPWLALHSGWPLDDPSAWSGVVVPMVAAIEQHRDARRLPALDVRDALVDRLRARLSRRPVLPRHSTATALRRSHALRSRLGRTPPDLLVAIAASTDVVVSPGAPVLQITDATFDAVTDFYPQYSGLSRGSRRRGARVERLAAGSTAHFLVASDWAKRSLVDDVGVHPGRITVAPFGPAITPPSPLPVRDRTDGPLELLFVASDWERKDGTTALRIHEALHPRRSVRLTIVGTAPDLGEVPGVRTLGRIPPQELSRLYASSDVLLEPSRANAAGVVVTDALSHGLPAMAADVGGTATLLRPGIGGWLLPPRSFVEDAVGILGALDRAALRELSRSAARDAQERLSWEAWAVAFDRAADSALRTERS